MPKETGNNAKNKSGHSFSAANGVVSLGTVGGKLLIGPGDMLEVQVFDTPEWAQQVRVNDAGEIDLVVGGTVKVAGLTPSAAKRVVEAALQPAPRHEEADRADHGR